MNEQTERLVRKNEALDQENKRLQKKIQSVVEACDNQITHYMSLSSPDAADTAIYILSQSIRDRLS